MIALDPNYDRDGVLRGVPFDPYNWKDEYDEGEVDGYGVVIGSPEEREAFHTWLRLSRHGLA
ncbi:hypothetical protein [Cryptosporangium phraense]|uniref:Uncharacterized protein n=1 Tax=Cryptosporangium phraense TaxID=2593070 RepID=A0A545AM52_9ACTN|nr:hypothetical protein [Cryptosporangium phraense]TQS42330.1 hypothetical protein FL583_25755 [Cryptosporangium phraense]